MLLEALPGVGKAGAGPPLQSVELQSAGAARSEGEQAARRCACFALGVAPRRAVGIHSADLHWERNLMPKKTQLTIEFGCSCDWLRSGHGLADGRENVGVHDLSSAASGIVISQSKGRLSSSVNWKWFLSIGIDPAMARVLRRLRCAPAEGLHPCMALARWSRILCLSHIMRIPIVMPSNLSWLAAGLRDEPALIEHHLMGKFATGAQTLGVSSVRELGAGGHTWAHHHMHHGISHARR